MTLPSTQNLKTLGFWIFFLICCSTFSFVSNVGLRLTLEYLTISLSSESPFSTLIHSPSSGSILKPEPEYITHDPSLVLPFTHLYGTHLPETSIRKTFDTGSNCTRPSCKPSPLIPTCWENQRGKPWGDLTRMRQEPTHIRK